MQLFLLLLLIILVVLGVLTVQNPGTAVSMTFFKWTIEGPLAFVLAVPFATGLLIGIVLFVPMWWKKAKLVRQHKKHVHELEHELAGAREQLEQLQPSEETEGLEGKELEEQKSEFS